MDDRSWIYRDSPQGLRRMDYCNGVQGFINFATSIPRNFTGGDIRCPCRKCENKKYLHPDVVMMHLLHKGFMENYQCCYAHGEVFGSKRRMEEMVVGSTSSANNVHEAANDNTKPYRNMVMDAMRMNQGNGSQCSIVEEELNADAARFFDLLKDSDEPLWDGCTNHSKLSAVAQVFTIKSDHGLSEAGYDKIMEWARSILPEGNRLKENFYAAKSMMKPLSLRYQNIDNAEMTECMTCGHSRYKPRTGKGKTLVAYKKIRYFPITPRLQRLFMSPRTAEHMTWHQAHHAVDGVMVHPSDGKAWKHFNSVHPHFLAESRNVRLGLCTDGFNPFGSFAATYSCWLVQEARGEI